MAYIQTAIRHRINSPDPAAKPLMHKNPSANLEPRRLLEWSELPEWQQEDSSYVKTGYRIATPSSLQCLSTLGYLHNETINIFSHLIGAVVFYACGSAFHTQLRSRSATADTTDMVVFAIYLFGVASCYTLSVLFHTIMSHSAKGCRFGIQLDFQGIILLIWSATIPMVYYTFRTERTLKWVYWSLITISGAMASVVTFTPAFHKPATKPLRAGVFGALAISTLASVIHGIIANGWSDQHARFSMWGIGGTLFFNVLGALVYVLRFPERWYPRTFDIFGASHQLMHVSIFVASLSWLWGMVQAFDHVHGRA